MLILYGTEVCDVCKAAEEKFKKLGIPYEKCDIVVAIEHHNGWQDDDTINLMVAFVKNNTKYPIIKIDDKFYNYPEAMRVLKGRKKPDEE